MLKKVGVVHQTRLANFHLGLQCMQGILGYQSHSSKASPQQLHQKLRKQLLSRLVPAQLVTSALRHRQCLTD